jgi:hypothetical protein
MDLVRIPAVALPASPRCIVRAHRLIRVKFVSLPPDREPEAAPRGRRASGRGVVSRFLSRVIGCLVAARP